MYLRGSKFNMNRRRRSGSPPVRIALLVVLVGALVYINQVIVPTTPPLFLPTSTPTRAPESYTADAEDLANGGKFTQAIQAYNQAILVNAKDPNIYVALARLQVYTGAYADAIKSAENSLLLNSNNSMAQAIRGWALGFQGDFLGAEGALNKAIEIDNSNAVAYGYLAEIYSLEIQNGKDQLGTLDKAKQASYDAQRLGPNLMETHRGRGMVLEVTSNYEEAAREFAAAIAVDPNIADLHLALGRNYDALQQYVKAVEEYNRANALNPSDPLPSTYIARTYEKTGDFPKAIQYAQQAIKVSPLDPFLYGNLGIMYSRNKQYSEAITPLRLAVRGGVTADGQTIKGIPLDYGRIAAFYYTYGLAEARLGECNEALQISQLLLNGVPNDDTSVYNAQQMPIFCQQFLNGTPTPTRPAVTSTPTKKP
jgi:tetratricopeptide (TPR) repeat protein